MAEKQTALSIVIRTIDNATAGIHHINKKLDELTKPTREFGKALHELAEKSGASAVVEGFKGVGEAVKETLFKVLEAGAIIGELTHLVLELSEKFEHLGKVSERLGVTVDFLAGMRYAAGKTGQSVESLDQGFQTFVQNLGQARAGTGRMVKFLNTVSPALLRQLLATKSNQAAWLLLADAMEKVTDPAKRLALAQKTVGDAALAPVLHQGSKELIKQGHAYEELAGSQEEAVKSGTEVGEAMKDLHAVIDGVEAALVVGLAPALKIVIEKLTEWFKEHREDIARWVADIGTKIPDAVDKVVAAIRGAVEWVMKFVDDIGGWKVAALGLAAVLAGPLLLSVANLGVALVSMLARLAALPGALSAATSAASTAAGAAAGAGKGSALAGVAKFIAPVAVGLAGGEAFMDKTEELLKEGQRPSVSDIANNALFNLTAAKTVTEARIKLDITGAPRGSRATVDPRNTADVDLTVGHQLGGFGP